MSALSSLLSITALSAASAFAQSQPITIAFKAVVGSESFACGRSYSGIGITKSTIKPKDFRIYVHGVRLIDEKGTEVPVQLAQRSRWQLEDVALLDFESGSAGCANGNPDMNMEIQGTVPSGRTYRGLRFILGVPFDKNHTDLTQMPPPLDMTALAWTWNAGRKFTRIEFSSTGRPNGYVLHLGSTGCTPNNVKTAPPTSCLHPNRAEINLADFQLGSSIVVADLAALLSDSNVDLTPEKYKSGCMSSETNPDCDPLFRHLGLPFGDRPATQQNVFRVDVVRTPVTEARR